MPKKQKPAPITEQKGHIHREDSWKGTPLEPLEEERPSTSSSYSRSPPPLPPLSPSTEAIEKQPDGKTLINDDVCESEMSKQRTVVGTAEKEEVAVSSTAAENMLSPAMGAEDKGEKNENFNGFVEPVVEINGLETAEETKQKAEETPTAAVTPSISSSGDGGSARKELEDAIQRIEVHIKTEQAARRAAEGALAQALQIKSPLPVPAIAQDHSNTTAALASDSSFSAALHADLRAVLSDLVNAQQALQRSHAIISHFIEPNNTASSSSSLATNISSSPSAILMMGGEGGTTVDRTMSWSAGRPKLGHERNLPHVKVRPAPIERVASLNSPAKPPKARKPFAAGRETPMGTETPTKRGVDMSSSAHEDRFATRKSEDFILKHSARWNGPPR